MSEGVPKVSDREAILAQARKWEANPRRDYSDGPAIVRALVSALEAAGPPRPTLEDGMQIIQNVVERGGSDA